jgi:protoporphyrinogen oxidase
MPAKQVIVIGGGPAGLTAAYELTRYGVPPYILEKNNRVGGLARTENYKGYLFDLGGHRFFTKSEQVMKLWHDVLTEELLTRPRLSRIYYKKRFFYYPLRPLNALIGLGLFESVLILLSYIRWQLFPYRQEDTFEQWVTNRFGRRLFRTFFKTYTEKVWGIPCSELRAEWAAQRIKDLSLRTALLSMFFRPRKTIKTLIERFEYPRLGPGMMWNTFRRRIEEGGGTVLMNSDVVRVQRTCNRIDRVVVSCNGREEMLTGTDFISSMPVTEFIKKLDPPAPPEVREAADKLRYRDFLTVCLIVNKPELFPDNWVYVHDPQVQIGRIQNFKNWSPDMVPDSGKTCLGLEYFCTEGDALWTRPDADLIELGKREVDRIGLACAADIVDGCVVRVPKSYPVYDSDYRGYLATIRRFVDRLENFQTIGRNGLHRYNNQDHAMLTGILAVRNLLFGEANDLWSVNTDQEYHEEIRPTTGAGSARADMSPRGAERSAGRLGRAAAWLALGAVLGLLAFLVILLLVLRADQSADHRLAIPGPLVPGSTRSSWVGVLGLSSGIRTGWNAAWWKPQAVPWTNVTHRRARRAVPQPLSSDL